ncbi:hypothetical protein [Corynebacterium sp. A21]|uniref:hypothetical protein n=1 Tax=Corynebacterium sp. A21 TaxID=3457318 RepID=UPI003FD3E37C
MRRRIPALLGASLLLTGCATEQSRNSDDEAQATNTLNDAAGVTAAAELALGTWAPADCPADQPCDVEFRVTDILVAETCEFGLKPDAEPLPDNTWVITVYTEAKAGLTFDGKPHMFPSPEVIDTSGKVQPASYDQPCADNPAHAGFDYLLTGIDENSEGKYADILAIPAHSEALLFEGHRITLPGAGESSGMATPAEPSSEGSSVSGDSVPAEGPGAAAGGSSAGDPYAVGECAADGTALFSDGQRRAVAGCASGSVPSAGSGEDLPYRCADSGRQVEDPADCSTTPSTTNTPRPPQTTTTAPAPTTIAPSNPGRFPSEFEKELWTACANGEVTDKLVCDTMYQQYGRP